MIEELSPRGLARKREMVAALTRAMRRRRRRRTVVRAGAGVAALVAAGAALALVASGPPRAGPVAAGHRGDAAAPAGPGAPGGAGVGGASPPLRAVRFEIVPPRESGGRITTEDLLDLLEREGYGAGVVERGGRAALIGVPIRDARAP